MYTEKQLKEAYGIISDLLKEAQGNLNQAVEVAEKYGLEFDWSPAWGFGGSYVPQRVYLEQRWEEEAEEIKEEFENPNLTFEDWVKEMEEEEPYENEWGWVSSSSMC